jgi:hypothetical protein
MNDAELFDVLRSYVPNSQAVSAIGVVWIAWKLRVIEARLNTVSETIAACPTCRKHLPTAALLFALAFLAAALA